MAKRKSESLQGLGTEREELRERGLKLKTNKFNFDRFLCDCLLLEQFGHIPGSSKMRLGYSVLDEPKVAWLD